VRIKYYYSPQRTLEFARLTGCQECTGEQDVREVPLCGKKFLKFSGDFVFEPGSSKRPFIKIGF
jgi:hypothetical protein